MPKAKTLNLQQSLPSQLCSGDGRHVTASSGANCRGNLRDCLFLPTRYDGRPRNHNAIPFNLETEIQGLFFSFSGYSGIVC